MCALAGVDIDALLNKANPSNIMETLYKIKSSAAVGTSWLMNNSKTETLSVFSLAKAQEFVDSNPGRGYALEKKEHPYIMIAVCGKVSVDTYI
ncbi:MAG: hypothetical protein LBT59_20530, partial [Clostridiales bacterium]|nr:hypothetical protein [Clostridiales bacterium]